MTTATELRLAEARSRLARARLKATASTMQRRLAPAVLARTAVDNIAEGGERALTTSVTAARRNPQVAAGAAALAMLLLLRRPIVRLFRGPDKKRRNPPPREAFEITIGPAPVERIDR